MNDSYGITVENLMKTLPDVLKDDEKMLALASSIAEVLSGRVEEINKLKIYTRIDELPEDLLDILAYDFKVDWYGYNYGLDAKRSLIKNSFNVHRHIGTRGAVEKALSDIYPGSEVEEWFEYGGDPYYFRVILDVTNQRVSITQAEIVKAIDIYKSLRSHLEDEAIIYRSRVHIGIGMVCGYVVYATHLCGTFPVRATQGSITDEDITIVSTAVGTAYATPRSGTIWVGQYPAVATQGSTVSGEINMGTNGNGTAYSVRFCGSTPGSII